MIITEQFTFNNSKPNVDIKDMVKILTHLHIRLRNSYEQDQDNMIALSNYFYNLIIMRELRDFIDWHPYIRNCKINIIYKLLKKYTNVHTESYGYETVIDEKIKVLWFLWENDAYYETYERIPPRIMQLYRVFNFTKYYLQKIFELDYKPGKMRCFRNSDPISDVWHNHHKYGYYSTGTPPWLNNILEYDGEFNILKLDKPDEDDKDKNEEKLKILISRRNAQFSDPIEYIASSSDNNITTNVVRQTYSNIDTYNETDVTSYDTRITVDNYISN